ncbi:MAG: hypothetical protein IJQ20_04615 [Paludibacteraceae bacterium]|nr:hypothetical protein [Paludibacteraceae bacterium]
MGKVHFLDPVDYISGKISKKFRTVYNRRRISDRRYTSVHGDRTTSASVEEIEHRLKFKTVRLAALNRSMDLSHLTYDQMDFIAEKKAKGSAFKYSTFKGWLFGKAYKCYNESTNTVTMPERLNTIG